MERADFVHAVDVARAERPGPWSLPGASSASETDIAEAEMALGCRLPDDYQWFVQRFGGGLFGFAEIYSVEPHSRDGVVDRNDRPWIDTSTFVAFADNGCGDYYGWRVLDGVAQPEVVFFDHEDDVVRPHESGDFLSCVAALALR